MASSFTTLWTRQRCQEAKQAKQEGAPMTLLFGGPHRSQPSFRRAGVSVGDSIYPISVSHGLLYLIARMRVKTILSLEEYIDQNPTLFAPYKRTNWSMETLNAYLADRPWQRYLFHNCTDEVVVADESTPIRFDLTVPPEIVEGLRYRSQRRERPIKHQEQGRITSVISLQGIYRLSEASAVEFERLASSESIKPTSRDYPD